MEAPFEEKTDEVADTDTVVLIKLGLREELTFAELHPILKLHHAEGAALRHDVDRIEVLCSTRPNAKAARSVSLLGTSTIAEVG